MQADFHYYATYCAAYLAGYSHEEAQELCFSAQFVDCCTKTFITRAGGPAMAATTQSQLELADAFADIPGLQNMTRIWASFHFLPYDLKADYKKRCGRRYLNKYRLLCDANGDLVEDTVNLAKGGSLQAAGIAMHVLADTWAHRYFAGTPSFVINNASYFFDLRTRQQIRFSHNPTSEDDAANGKFSNSIYQSSENSIMNLGHGRAGHLPDYSFMRYTYIPAWSGFRTVTKDNPTEYYHAFTQMVYALRFLRGESHEFRKGMYDTISVEPYREEIMEILQKEQLSADADWKVFGEKLSGREIEDFDEIKYEEEYVAAGEEDKAETYLGKFFDAAINHKAMVTNRIFRSGSMLAGVAIDNELKGIRGLRQVRKYIKEQNKLEAADE